MSLDTLQKQPLVETDRFDLRPLHLSDMGLLGHYAGDKRVAQMTASIPHPLPPGAIEAFVKRATAPDRDEMIWAIDGTKAEGPELMGVMSLKVMDKAQAELSYWVGPPFWNTGLASLAASAIVEANPLGNETLFASVFQDNPASARVLTNCGFEYIGDAEAYSVARGATVPTWTYINRLT
ncbi:GNAT family N-acetyltransferase [Tropicibacter oceani]|uniref:GNAT family N-acetyltransferase n=1 Tax=Tropicibacter oceani TaxID=3058420 RepID=A0ABY8QGP2_9RHOB|nr:GNAT family N-acetyltransferase [Tropicibacter oceani]WGW02967.1 GNAT family N-acetyltransferase [Tropicibacter oceani]